LKLFELARGERLRLIEPHAGELQRHNLTPETLNLLAGQMHEGGGLGVKLQGLGTGLREYLDWLTAHNLQDADCLLGAAADSLESEVQSLKSEEPRLRTPHSEFRIQNVWVDGFTEWSPQELELLAALIPHCDRATITFCLDRVPAQKVSWLSSWSVVREAFDKCRKRLESLAGAEVAIELLPRKPLLPFRKQAGFAAPEEFGPAAWRWGRRPPAAWASRPCRAASRQETPSWAKGRLSHYVAGSESAAWQRALIRSGSHLAARDPASCPRRGALP
jgi:hypothetical protein